LGQIIWLASYPKSGNTWLRAFLANYRAGGSEPVEINRLPELSFSDSRVRYFDQVAGRPTAGLPFAEIHRLRPAVHRLFAQARDGQVLVKTHCALSRIDDIPTITPELTAAALYVVRTPLDVAVSFAHHFGLSMASAVQAISFPQLKSAPRGDTVAQPFSDWSSHVQSWLDAPGLKLYWLRYEDLHRAPARVFKGVIAFLGWPFEAERLRNAIRQSDFRTLAAQEARAGFVEASRKAERFFRRGQIGSWRSELTADQVAFLIERHRAVMTRLGYLGPDGKPAVREPERANG